MSSNDPVRNECEVVYEIHIMTCGCEIISARIIAVFKGKDTICILPTGYGKSLIYKLLPNVFDFFLSSEENFSSIIVVSPLNALIQDRINKVRGHLNVWILKDHRYSVGKTKFPNYNWQLYPCIFVSSVCTFSAFWI